VIAPTEDAIATSESIPRLDELGAAGTIVLEGHRIPLTNLDKVLFPARDFEPAATKRDLVGYFLAIAPVLVPHLRDRAVNLHRYPDGALGPGFWQKDLPDSAPSWLSRWRETGVSGRAPNEHLVVDGAAALCWLANQAAFEIHPWTAPTDDPMHPDFALIDIDPGERTSVEETLLLARLFGTALEQLGVIGYPKTTGRRGIQAWIPVEGGRYTFSDTSQWVERVSRAVGASVPDLVSWEWAKDRRRGLARLDYTQNAPIKTLVAPYAVRPAPGGPVSTPVTWQELEDPLLRPDGWTMRTVLARVQRLGDLFAGVRTHPQTLPPI
jgi:bifunctional non-homologous end joining protein LigD